MSKEYEEAAEKLLEAYKGVIGQAALGIAKRNDNVHIEEGEIESFDGGEDELEELIENYHSVMGDVAYTLASQKLGDAMPENIS